MIAVEFSEALVYHYFPFKIVCTLSEQLLSTSIMYFFDLKM